MASEPQAHDTGGAGRAIPRRPVIEKPSWRICEMPDLGDLAGRGPAQQHVVDHGFGRADNGTWQLWACIRGTAVGRLLYRWQGGSLDEGPWRPLGIAARATEAFGEDVSTKDGRRVEGIGAPFMLRVGGAPRLLYHSNGIRMMTSAEGVEYERADLGPGRGNLLYGDGGRDVMVLPVGGRYYAYSTVTTPERTSFVALRTTKDFLDWTPRRIVCRGGKAGAGPVDAESPFVVFLDGFYYLFRSSSISFKTFVYRSPDPTDFGVDSDDKLIAEFDLKAPELIRRAGRWYISDLADFNGIRLARLRWDEAR